MSYRFVAPLALALFLLALVPAAAASADCPTAPLFDMSGPVCTTGRQSAECGCSECVAWNAATGAAWYEIRRCDSSGANCVIVGDTRRNSSNTARAQKPLWCPAWDSPFPHRGVLYQYSVRACKDGTTGPSCSTGLSPAVTYAAAPYMCISGGVEIACTGASVGTSTPSDLDGNGIPDVLDPDMDGDGVPNAADNCPRVPNIGQRDADRDRIGDACDSDPKNAQSGSPDADSDGVGDLVDNCGGISNATQLDTDADKIGDPCDNCPVDWNREQTDTDHDGAGDVCDVNDGVIYLTWASRTRLTWRPEVGFTTWSAYRGDLAVLRSTGVYTQAPGTNALASRWCGLATTALDDSLLPVSRACAFYLVAGRNTASEGDLGKDSSGRFRPNTSPCP